MIRLGETEAVEAVRKNMLEVGANASAMYNDTDNDDLDEIIRKTIPEAINAVNTAAPSALLEGVEMLAERAEYIESSTVWVSDFQSLEVKGRTVEFTLSDTCLRIVALRAFDSDVVLTDEVPEMSAQGRMQLNPFTRGTFDNPVLVRAQIRGSGKPTYGYYSLLDDYSDFNLVTWLQQHGQSGRGEFPLATVEYMPYCKYRSGTLYHSSIGIVPYYEVSDALREAVINQLTGMVLAIYGEADKAKYFFSSTGLTPSSNE